MAGFDIRCKITTFLHQYAKAFGDIYSYYFLHKGVLLCAVMKRLKVGRIHIKYSMTGSAMHNGIAAILMQ